MSKNPMLQTSHQGFLTSLFPAYSFCNYDYTYILKLQELFGYLDFGASTSATMAPTHTRHQGQGEVSATSDFPDLSNTGSERTSEKGSSTTQSDKPTRY